MKLVIGSLLLLIAAMIALFTIGAFVSVALPWLRAPANSHYTWVIAGVSLAGWQILVPLIVLAMAAGGFGFLGIWTLNSRD